MTGTLLLSSIARGTCAVESADVSWVRSPGAESCPTASAIRREVTRRIGKPIGSPGEGRVIEATVERGEGRWSARIITSGCGEEPAVRKLESDASSCEPIASAAVLVIALAIDPRVALAPPAPEASEGDTAASASPPPSPPMAAPSPKPKPAPPEPGLPKGPPPLPRAPEPGVETRITVRGLVALGLLPSEAPGVAWSSEWRFPPWIVASTGLLFLPERSADDPTFAFGMTAGWIGGCADLLRFSQISIGPCARVLAGTIHAVLRTHPTIVGTEPGQRFWAGGSAGARLTARIAGPLQAELGADLIAPITRHAFKLRDDPEPIFLQPPVASALYAGAGLAFP